MHRKLYTICNEVDGQVDVFSSSEEVLNVEVPLDG